MLNTVEMHYKHPSLSSVVLGFAFPSQRLSVSHMQNSEGTSVMCMIGRLYATLMYVCMYVFVCM